MLGRADKIVWVASEGFVWVDGNSTSTHFLICFPSLGMAVTSRHFGAAFRNFSEEPAFSCCAAASGRADCSEKRQKVRPSNLCSEGSFCHYTHHSLKSIFSNRPAFSLTPRLARPTCRDMRGLRRAFSLLAFLAFHFRRCAKLCAKPEAATQTNQSEWYQRVERK